MFVSDENMSSHSAALFLLHALPTQSSIAEFTLAIVYVLELRCKFGAEIEGRIFRRWVNNEYAHCVNISEFQNQKLATCNQENSVDDISDQFYITVQGFYFAAK